MITSSDYTTGCVTSVCFLLIRQTVIRAHRQQLDEMACLCFKEECLINQMSAMVSVSNYSFWCPLNLYKLILEIINLNWYVMFLVSSTPFPSLSVLGKDSHFQCFLCLPSPQ